jgi:tetraacyldisaccharide 4'-kinase
MWRVLVFPFACIYGSVVFVRNKFYDWGIFRSREFNLPVISVGNLSVGGSGKTPHIEYLIRLLRDEFSVAVLSRGYKRKTHGFHLVKQQATPAEVGDEPSQIKQKFRKITVAVDEKRAHGIEMLQKADPYLDVILLDDAFQHRSVKPGLSILITDFHLPFTEDYLMPSGTLREHAAGYKRADIIIISKAPKVLSPITKRRLFHEINPLPNQDLFFTHLKYSECRHVIDGSPPASKEFSVIVMISGIANAYPMEEKLRSHTIELIKMEYPDHYQYKRSDIKKIKKVFDNIFTSNKALVTTEKDAIRLRAADGIELLKDLPLYFLPVEVVFHKGQKQEFEQRVFKYVRENTPNN